MGVPKIQSKLTKNTKWLKKQGVRGLARLDRKKAWLTWLDKKSQFANQR